MTRAKRIAKWAGLGLAGLIAVTAIALGLAYAYAQSAGGRTWLAERLARLLSEPGGIEVAIEGLSGRLPQAPRIAALRVRDARGTWLAARDLELDWHPLALLGGTVRVSRLEIGHLGIERRPEGPPKARRETGGLGLTSPPVALVIERLAVAEVALGEAVLGTPAAFRIEGEATGRDTGDLRASLRVARSDGLPGRIVAETRYDPRERRLALDLEASEPAGGLIARAFDIAGLPAVDLRLAGDGPLDGWNGRLTLALADLARLDAQIGLGLDADLGFRVTGRANSDRVLEALPWRLVSGATSFAVDGRWRRPGTLTINRAQLESAALDLALAGRLDTGSLDLEAEARARLETPGASAGRVTAELTFVPESPLDRAPPAGRIAASGTAEPLRIEAAAAWQPALGRRLAWRLEGRADLGAGKIAAERLAVETESMAVTGSGRYALKTGAGRAELEVGYPDLGDLGALLGTEAAGRAQLAATVTAGGFGETLDAELSGELRDLALADPLAQSLFAGRADFQAALSLGPAEGLRLRGVSVETGVATLTGDARLGPDFRRLEASYAAEVKDLGGPGAALGRALSGSARIEGRAEGALDSLGLSGTLTVAQAVLDGRPLGALDLDYQVRDVPGQPSGRLDAKLSGPIGDVRAETRYRYDGAALELSGLSLEGNATEAKGRARIPVDGGPVAAEFSVGAATLEPWLAPAGVAATGRGRAQVTLTAAGLRQAATIDAAFEDVTIRLDDGEVLSLAELTARLKSEDLLDTRRGTVALAGRDLTLGELALRSVTAEAAGGPAGGTVNVSAAGQWYGELQLQAEGRVSVSPDALSLQVSRLDGKALGAETELRQPLRIARNGAVWEVADLDLAYGGARLKGVARRGPKHLSAELSAADFPIAALGPVLAQQVGSGLLDASVRIEGPPAALTGRMALSSTGLRLDALPDGPALQLALDGDWRAGRLAVTGRVRGLAAADAVLSATLPLELDAATLRPVVPATKALSGRLTWQGPVEPIWALAPVTGQTLSGTADLRVALTGTLKHPDVTGRLEVKGGRYENLELGTLLRDLELQMELDGRRATLTRLTARDGAAGSLSASGAIDLLPEQGFPTDLAAEFKAFHLVRRDDVTASSSGRLQLQGTARTAKLSGRLRTELVEIRIPDRLPADIVDLKAVEEGASPPAATRPPAAAGDRRFELPLDVTVEMPRRVFLRGRGLDSEWAGTLAVAGTVERPEVEGKLTMVRGQIDMVGKDFKFERGSIDFVGGQTIDPLLDMKAGHGGKDLSVAVEVSGRASDPGFALNSTPDLPQDEIVSRLLFDKTTGQLSALEAAQLAAAAAKLSGAGVGGGLLEGLRRSLGIDVLRVETVGEGDAASTGIAAGKYVTDEIFLGVTQGAAADSGAVNVEVEVSPHIFIDTEVEQTGKSNVGIKFKWDY